MEKKHKYKKKKKTDLTIQSHKLFKKKKLFESCSLNCMSHSKLKLQKSANLMVETYKLSIIMVI